MARDQAIDEALQEAQKVAAETFIRLALVGLPPEATVGDLIQGLKRYGYLDDFRALMKETVLELMGGEAISFEETFPPPPPPKSVPSEPATPPISSFRAPQAADLEGAFDYYVELGRQRTYQAVADHFAVSRRTVARRAAAEGWKKRLTAIKRAVAADAAEARRESRQARKSSSLDTNPRRIIEARVLDALDRIGRPAHLKEVHAVVGDTRGQVWATLGRLIESEAVVKVGSAYRTT